MNLTCSTTNIISTLNIKQLLRTKEIGEKKGRQNEETEVAKVWAYWAQGNAECDVIET